MPQLQYKVTVPAEGEQRKLIIATTNQEKAIERTALYYSAGARLDVSYVKEAGNG